MDAVYYVRPGERNEELRYSLRSLANLEHDRVWIIGHAPAWVRGVERLPGNREGSVQANAVAALLSACEHVEGDRFVIMNDDFYILEPLAAVPSWHDGLLVDRAKAARGGYGNHLREALRVLTELGHQQPTAWTLHIPVVVWRDRLAAILSTLAGKVLPEWRTMYGNLAGETGEQAPDVKVRRRTDPMPDGPFLSSSDATFRWLHPWLAARFPTPSPYEVTA